MGVDLVKKRERESRWHREKRVNETPEEREARLALRREKRGLTPRGAAWTPEHAREYHREYFQRNWERLMAANRLWREEHPEEARVQSAKNEGKRRAQKWGTATESCPHVKAKYEIAAWLRAQGDNVHVDHIIPLSRGGKHTADNLQILTATENLRKGARVTSLESN